MIWGLYIFQIERIYTYENSRLSFITSIDGHKKVESVPIVLVLQNLGEF